MNCAGTESARVRVRVRVRVQFAEQTRPPAHLVLIVVHVLQDVHVDDGAQVVHVGDEQIFLALRQQLVDEARVGDGVKEIAVTGWVPI